MPVLGGCPDPGASDFAEKCSLFLKLTIPQEISETLANQRAKVRLTLTLINVLGEKGFGSADISFVPQLLPVAVALSQQILKVLPDRTESVELEISTRATIPTSGAPSVCTGAVGRQDPVVIEWRYGRRSLDSAEIKHEQAATMFGTLQQLPDSLKISGRPTVVKGTLGDLMEQGSILFFIARVAHASAVDAVAETSVQGVYLVFNVEIARASGPTIALDAPAMVSKRCPLHVDASRSISRTMSSADISFEWSCELLLEDGSAAERDRMELSLCKTMKGPKLTLPSPLSLGLYRIQATAQDNSGTTQMTTMISVQDSQAPVVQILAPSAPSVLRSGLMNFRASVQGDDECLPKPLSAVVVLVGTAPGDSNAVVETRIVQPVDLLPQDPQVATQVNMDDLNVGTEYHFLLILGGDAIDMKRHVQAFDRPPDEKEDLKKRWPLSARAVQPPSGAFAFESPTFMRALPPKGFVQVHPSEGFAVRTLFNFQTIGLCVGCSYSYRFAPAPVNLTDDAFSAVSSWRLLRPWSPDADVTLSLLEGDWVVEGRMRDQTNAESRGTYTVVHVGKADSGGQDLNDAKNSEQAVEVVASWVEDVSRSVSQLRSAQQPDAAVLAMHAVIAQLPDLQALQKSFGNQTVELALPSLLTFFDDVVEALGEAVLGIDSSVFRRYSGGRRLDVEESKEEGLVSQIVAITETLLSMLRKLRLALSRRRGLKVADVCLSLLARNAEVQGLLGGMAGSPPPAASILLGVGAFLISIADEPGNIQGVDHGEKYVPAGSAEELAGKSLELIRKVGDVVAASLPVDAAEEPVEIHAAMHTGGPILSVRRISSRNLGLSGLHLAPPIQAIKRPPYPEIKVSTVSLDELRAVGPSKEVACISDRSYLESFALLVIQWGPDKSPRRWNSADSEIEKIKPYDLHVRSCGVPVELKNVKLTFELPGDLLDDRRQGYGDISPFDCVHWDVNSWTSDGCQSVYRAPARTVKCSCNALWGTTWAVQLVPNPEFTEPSDGFGNGSIHNVLTYGWVFLFVICVLPMLGCAWVGDKRLALHGEPSAMKASQLLLEIPRDIPGEMARKVEDLPDWLMRIGLVHEYLELRFLFGELQQDRFRSLEVKELAALRSGQGGFESTMASNPQQPQGLPDMVSPPKTHLHREQDEGPRSFRPGARTPPQQVDPDAIVEKEHYKPFTLRKAAAATAASSVPPPQATPPRTPLETPRIESPRDEYVPTEADLRPQFELRPDEGFDDTGDWGDKIRQEIGKKHIRPKPLLPIGWTEHWSEKHGGVPYYRNTLNDQVQWHLPLHHAVKSLTPQELQEQLGGASAVQGKSRHEQETMLMRKIASQEEEPEPSMPPPLVAQRLPIQAPAHSELDRLDRLQKIGGPPRLQSEGYHRAPPPVVIEDTYGLPGTVEDEEMRSASPHQFMTEALHRSPGIYEPKIHNSYNHPRGQEPTSPGADQLPPGWKIARAPDGQPYYYHEGTQETQWEVPMWPEDDLQPKTASASKINLIDEKPSQQAPAVGNVILPGDKTGKEASTAKVAPEPARSDSRGKKARPDQLQSTCLRLVFLKMSFKSLFFHCWLRRCPPLAMLLPRLDFSKRQRAAWVLLHFHSALITAALVSVCLETPDDFTDDVDDPDQIEFVELWKALPIAFKSAWLPGLVCYVAANLITMAVGPRPVTTPAEFTSDRKQEIWWRQVKRTGDRQVLKSIVLSLFLGAGGLIVCALFPQPRAAVALAAFIFGHMGLHVITVPLLRALADAIVLRRSTRSDRHDCLLSVCPSLLDFSHCQIRSWSSGPEITSHWDLVLDQLKIIRWAMEERQLFAKELGLMR